MLLPSAEFRTEPFDILSYFKNLFAISLPSSEPYLDLDDAYVV